MAAHLLDAEYGPALALKDKPGIVCFEDHLSYLHRSPVHVAQGLVADVLSLSRGHGAFVARHGLVDHGYLHALEAGDPGNTGSPPGATSPPSRPSAPKSSNPPVAPAPTAAQAPRPIQPR